MNKYLPILVFFILADVVCDNTILRVFGTQPPVSALILSMGMLALQMLAAPIQAGFSDFYCRKNSLIIALAFSFISLTLLFFTKSHDFFTLILFILVMLLKGSFGNTVPLVWSALADTQEKNLRFSLALSTGAYAVGYMVLAMLNMRAAKGGLSQPWLSPDSMPILLFVLSIVFCLIFFHDVRDRRFSHRYQNGLREYLKLVRSEFLSLIHDFRRSSTRYGLLAYFFWATSQYSVLILMTDFEVKYTSAVILMMSGYLTGVLILGFCRNKKDEIMIKSGFVITIISMIVFFIARPFMDDGIPVLSFCGFFYTLGNAFLSPSILSLFSKERDANQQGKGFGLIVSADSGGFLVASFVVILSNYLMLKIEYMVLFSFFAFLISWLPYSRYEKIRKDFVRVGNSN